ncbi:MAG: caspase family protein, partial [Dehalococcoidales bacterium]|nr:caspase family protein [Dehalococcoidales bacterium]
MKTLFKQFILSVICGILVTLLLLITTQPFTPAYAQESESECWAVIVGVSDYQYFDDLNYAYDDARELSQLLSPIWGADHIKLLTNSAATKEGIRGAITNWLAPMEEANDVVLFFWAGYQDYANGYLFPYDALTSSLNNHISADELDSWLGDLDSEKIVVMNTISEEFINVLGGAGRIILTPCTPDEDNWATSNLGHRVFTYYILEALREFEAADSDGNFELSVEEVFDYAQSRTTNLTASNPNMTTQHPQMSDHYSGELSLLMRFTFSTEPNLPSGTTILTLDGEGYSSIPPAFTWAPGSAHSLEVPSLVDAGVGTRYAFTSWDDGDTEASRTISHGGAYAANYQTQYLLTIESAYGNPEGAGWYEAGSTAPIQVVSIEEATTRHIFTGWSGDYSGTTASAS